MIKTHKPRGHTWTHASTFQCTKHFRDVDYYECLAPVARPLIKGFDDAWTNEEHDAKRRRIEKLADDFLNGVPLFISSARPCPDATKTVVSRTKNQVVHPKLRSAGGDNAASSETDSAIWKDVEDDGEMLLRLTNERTAATVLDPCSVPDDQSGEDVEHVAVCARAEHRQHRRSKRVLLSASPSKDALSKAANLRNQSKLKTNKTKETPSSYQAINTRGNAEGEDLAMNNEGTDECCLPARSSPLRAAQRGTNDRSLRRRGSKSCHSNASDHDGTPNEIEHPRKGDAQTRGINGPLPRDVRGASPLAMETMTLREGTPDSDDHVFYGTAQEDSSLQDPVHLKNDALNEGDKGRDNSGNAVEISHDRLPEEKPREQHGPADAGEAGGPGRGIPKTSYSIAAVSQNGTTPFRFRRMARTSHEVAEDNSPRISALEIAPRTESEAVDIQRVIADTEAPPIESVNCSALPIAIDAEENTNDDLSAHCVSAPALEQPFKSPAKTVDTFAEPKSKLALGESQLWAGTQFLMEKAQRELFYSPEKSLQPETPGRMGTPQQQARASSDSAPSARKSLRPLAQEHMPSTQQLLGSFEGWSTVKKPTVPYLRGSVLPTPTGKSEASSVMTHQSRSTGSPQSVQIDRSIDDIERSCNNLSHSVSSTAPPHMMTSDVFRNSTAFQSTDTGLIPSYHPRHSTQSPWHPSRPTGADNTIVILDAGEGDVTFTSFISGLQQPSYMGEAQPRSEMLRESPEISEAVDGLRSLLDVSDMEGILSQTR